MALEYDIRFRGLILEGHPTNPHDCFLLMHVDGLDAAPMREVAEDRVGTDGTYLGPVFNSGRQIELQGVIVAPSRAGLRAREAQLRSSLKPTRETHELTISGRVGDPLGGLVGPFRVTEPLQMPDDAGDGMWAKAFAVALRSPEPGLYDGTVEQGWRTVLVDPESLADLPGAVFPGSFPLGWTEPANAQATHATVGGDLPAPTVVTLRGPVTNPRLVVTPLAGGVTWALILSGTLAADETVTVDSGKRTALYGDGSNAYADLDRSEGSPWWLLDTGTYDLRLTAFTSAAGAQASVAWRDTYA